MSLLDVLMLELDDCLGYSSIVLMEGDYFFLPVSGL
jgi:hypothetical protein